MELFTFWRNSEFLIESYTLENSFCHFSRVHERRNYKDPIIARMYGATFSCRGSLDFESCYLRIRRREKSEETHVSALALRATAQNTHIAIRIDTLVVSVSVQLSHTRYHILFDAVSWLIDFLVSGCMFVMCSIRASSDSAGCPPEENWDVNVPLGDGQPLGIDAGFRTFWAILQDEDQTDLDTESRAADHPQGFGKLHQKTRFNVLYDRSESNS